MFCVSWFWRPEVRDQAVGRLLHSQAVRAGPVLASLAASGAQLFLGSCTAALCLPSLSICLRIQFSPCRKDTSPSGPGPTFDLILIICKDPISKEDHCHRHWGSRLQHLLGTQLHPYQALLGRCCLRVDARLWLQIPSECSLN